MSEPARIAWEQFTADPRRAADAGMRASDKDRDVALTALGEAFADGRLDRGEFDERTTSVQRAKHLGELVAPLADLAAPERVPSRATARAPRPEPTGSEPDRQPFAGRWVFLVPVVVCWVIWVSAAVEGGGFHPGFPWPLFVMLGTGWLSFGGGCGESRSGRSRGAVGHELRGVRRHERGLGRGRS